MALPTNVGKGTVRGEFIDSSGAPIEGVVMFKPTPKRLTNATATPRAVTILPKPVSVPLVNGAFEITDLIATNDPDNSPVDWQYRVEFQFAGGASADPFNIDLPEGAIVDLAIVTPVASTGGVQVIRGPGVPEFEDVPDGRVLVLVDGRPAWGEGGGGGVSSWNDLTDKPTTFTPATHSHSVANVTGLQAALDGKADATAVTTALAGKADATATTTALAGKAATSHAHSAADLTSGTVPIARIPTGATGTTVALGNHTHTAAQISDFTEAAQDAIAALLQGASGVTLSYDDTANTLTITGPGTTGLDAEAVRDAIGVALVGTAPIQITVNDAADTITISLNGLIPIANAPAGSVFFRKETSPGVYPTRGTSRTDLMFIWVGTIAPTIGGSYALTDDTILLTAT